MREAAGDRFAELELNILVQGVDTATGPATAAQWAKSVGFEAQEIIDSPFVLFGTESQLEEKLLVYRERFGISYITVFAAGMEAIAPVVARLSGR